MFFIMGIQDEERPLDFDQLVCCPVCGRYGRLRIVRRCTVLSLFFLPVFRWGRRYEARMGCCGASAVLPAELGRDVERGRATELDPSRLSFTGRGPRRCHRCGYETSQDFDFCPRCGTKF